MKITVFTPTFNRAHILPKLYNSLLKQTNQNFEWLIVDDGSTDNSKTIIDEWIKQNRIVIKYFYQKNSGKMMAHNLGVLKSEEELFMCVDSDDYLFDENVINKIITKWESVDNKEKETLSGIVAQKLIVNKGNKNIAIPNIYADTLSNLYSKYKFDGETALIFRTKILKKHLFPHIEGEKFITENYIYEQIDQQYKFLYYPTNCFTGEYMADGYTVNWIKTVIKNPKGWKLYYLQHMKYCNSTKDLIKTVYHYISISFIDKENILNIISNSNNKILTLLLLPIGWIKSHKDKKLYKHLQK